MDVNWGVHMIIGTDGLSCGEKNETLGQINSGQNTYLVEECQPLKTGQTACSYAL
jgi:hypothetical protein